MAVVVVACVLGLVVTRVALTQGQFRLDKMQKRAAEEQARYERLRLQAAELESPSRVVAAAQERLGMVPSPGMTYLSPTGPASGLTPAAPDDEQAAATEDWSKVKRQLTSQLTRR
ncbi:MAG: cell division protein FtsL [Actinomycetota bacterium]|nr:cell division protein FtsL [Actinomycetota bacterium]